MASCRVRCFLTHRKGCVWKATHPTTPNKSDPPGVARPLFRKGELEHRGGAYSLLISIWLRRLWEYAREGGGATV
jgi:hypothetical protein